MKESYQAYLLRLQRGPGSAQWRVTVQNAHTGEVLRFGSEREMFRFLWLALKATPAADARKSPEGERGGGAP